MGFDQAGNAASMLNRAGGMLQMDEQGRLDDERARFEGNRDFDMNTLMNYNAGILGRTPTSTGNIQNNMANPMMGMLSGAVGGFGAGGKIGDYFGNMFAPQQPMVQAQQVYNPQLAQNPALGGRFYGF